MTSTPARAAQPPAPCTIVEPAKSWNPSSLSHPPPQVQAPTIGEITAVNISVKMKKDHILIRSAMAPETIEAAVATKTIWKNQSDITAYPFSTTAAVASVAPSSRAISLADGQ